MSVWCKMLVLTNDDVNVIHWPKVDEEHQIQQDFMCRPFKFEFSIETDVSFPSANDIVGLGFILKDQQGNLMAAGCKTMRVNLVLSVEREVILEVLHFAAESGSRNI